jgi:nitric oxide reductase large subunit
MNIPMGRVRIAMKTMSNYNNHEKMMVTLHAHLSFYISYATLALDVFAFTHFLLST